MRLQKYMAQAGVASRRQCETYICEGRVRVNGEVAELGRVVDPEKDQVTLDGKRLLIANDRVVLLFYKPRGVVCTNHDPEGRKTVQDYFRSYPARLFHVGRLDINSEGLLIMTNDGELALRMTHPRYKVQKTYYVVCDGTLTEQERAQLQNGVQLEDGMTAPARVTQVRPTKTGQTSFLISIREGRNRQVRRMVEAVDHKTLLLKREQVGELRLDGISSGGYREATQEELAWLDASMQAALK